MELEIGKLLKSAWIAAILPILIASIPFPSSSHLGSFHRLVSSFAKRGKTSLHTSNKFTVPQRFFLHFYVVAVVWTTFLLLTTWLYAYKMVPLDHEPLHYTTIASHLTGGSHIFSRHKSHSTPYERRYIVWRTVLLLLLMEVQVSRRLYETVYLFNYSPAARMHIFGYFTGLLVAHAYVQFSARMILMTAVGCCFSEASFYTAAPLSLCSMRVPEVVNFAKHCVADFIVKGRDKMSILEFDWLGYVNPLTKLGWCQWIGVAIFFWGWIHQLRCHAILGLLRENKEETDEYTIPHGDWFEFVSCPHYLAEIVIYGGLLIASGGSDHTIWLLFGFVVVNLVFAAAETQRWYIRKFDNYPQTRRAILPFVY